MTLLTILAIVVLLAFFVACFCFWVNHGGFLGFYMAGQMFEVIGSFFQLLIHIIASCLASND